VKKMVCYLIPLIAAIISSVVWGAKRKGPACLWLVLLLSGSAMFGVVDHLLSGELFLISLETLHMDLFVGGVITATVFGGWGITFGILKTRPELAHRAGYHPRLRGTNR
jgi:hypothetical protein